MHTLVEQYPDVEIIRVVLDNLNTHRPGALYETYPPAEARRILNGSSFTSLRFTAAGSTWLKSKSTFSPVNALIAEFRMQRHSVRRSLHGQVLETRRVLRLCGNSRPKTLAPNCIDSIHQLTIDRTLQHLDLDETVFQPLLSTAETAIPKHPSLTCGTSIWCSPHRLQTGTDAVARGFP